MAAVACDLGIRYERTNERRRDSHADARIDFYASHEPTIPRCDKASPIGGRSRVITVR